MKPNKFQIAQRLGISAEDVSRLDEQEQEQDGIRRKTWRCVWRGPLEILKSPQTNPRNS